MKKSNLVEGILFVLGGVILLCIGLFTDSALDSLLIGLASGAICSGLVMTGKYIYRSRPQNRSRYQQKIDQKNIELHDELKSMLRDRSGRYSYIIGVMTVSLSIVIFSLLGRLGMIDGSHTLILYLSGYLLFQIVIGVVIFKHLLKKYE